MEDTEMIEQDFLDGSNTNLVDASIKQQESSEVPSRNGHSPCLETSDNNKPPKLPSDDLVLPDDKVTANANAKYDDSGIIGELPESKNDGDSNLVNNELKVNSPGSSLPNVEPFPHKAEDGNVTRSKNWLNDTEMAEADDSGTPEERVEFMKELESFYRENALEFKPPKFYGEPLNCLKLWRAVIRLGGYEVALLEYEKHKRLTGELQLPASSFSQPASAEKEVSGYQTPGSGRARRDAAARAMQGWHAQRLLGYGEVTEPIIKEKSLHSTARREKHLKSIGLPKIKTPTNADHAEKSAPNEADKQPTLVSLAKEENGPLCIGYSFQSFFPIRLIAEIVDIGPPADWVKISVRETKDCFEVYALVPGLLREEVRVQSDPAGRLVITGEPEHVDNPWGITPFKKVVVLPTRIDPLQTSAVVSLHGRLFVRVPFEHGSA
ncbi:hypothetical protein JRO89_XSUnG0021300 [Xanthoceras sorbifolium]|uniref:Uncharacterized protein n=1 Tax=Xanthoceras sorbifolium TaxID=99658 RepID=A0ABQ8H082_9ROSI|nr:hypothetical protein JRO89_XSUnG0021300 [Xanthoceras sorbifolium]